MRLALWRRAVTDYGAARLAFALWWHTEAELEAAVKSKRRLAVLIPMAFTLGGALGSALTWGFLH